jgi:hypothetical protein
MLQLSFTDPTMERAAVQDKYDLLIGVIATFVIEVAGDLVYREVMFPVVELRAQIADWLGSGFDEQADFRFQSLESEEPDLITLTSAGGGWRVAARHQVRAVDAVIPGVDVKRACASYIAAVDEWVRSTLQIEVGCYV